MDPRESCRQISPGAQLETPVSCAQGVPERARILQEQGEELVQMSGHARVPTTCSSEAENLERQRVPAGEKHTEMHTEAGSCCKNPSDFSSGKLGESETLSLEMQRAALLPCLNCH